MRLLAGALSAPAREALSADERPSRPRERSASPPKRERSADKLKFRTIFISDLHLVRACAFARPFRRSAAMFPCFVVPARFQKPRARATRPSRARSRVALVHCSARPLRANARAGGLRSRRKRTDKFSSFPRSLVVAHRAPRAARRGRCWTSCARRSASACTWWATSWTCGRAAPAASTGRRCVARRRDVHLYRARAQRADACAAQSHSDVIQKLLKKARKGTKSASTSVPRRVPSKHAQAGEDCALSSS